MSATNRLRDLVLDLLKAVEKVENDIAESVKKENYERDMEEVRLTLAKIEGLLQGQTNLINNFESGGDMNATQNIKKDGE